MTDQIGNDGRTGASLRQGIIVTRYLSQQCGDRWSQHEIRVLDEKPSDTTEIYRAKKVFEVNIEDVTFLAMPHRVGDDRPFPFETVREFVGEATLSVDFRYTVLEQYRRFFCRSFSSGTGALITRDPPPLFGMVNVFRRGGLFASDVR